MEKKSLNINLNDKLVFTFARKLACNDQASRSRSIKQLSICIKKLPDDVDELPLMRLCKGLHYCMWMADKPLYQESLAEKISKLMHAFTNVLKALSFFKAFMKVEATEWGQLDVFRLDKFMLMVRLVVREALLSLKSTDWKETATFFDGVKCTFMNRGLGSHVVDLLIPELKKVLNDQINNKEIIFFEKLINFFIDTLPSLDAVLAKEIKKNILYQLTQPDFKLNLEWLEEIVFMSASQKTCPHSKLLYTFIQQIQELRKNVNAKKRKSDEADNGIKKIKRVEDGSKEWDGMVRGAVKRLKKFELGIINDKISKKERKKNKKVDVCVDASDSKNVGDKEEDEEEEDSYDEFEDENDEEEEEKDDGNEEGEENEDDDDEEEENNDENGDKKEMEFSDKEENSNDDDENNSLEVAPSSLVNGLALGDLVTPDKKSVVFNNKCLSKKFHKNAKITPKFDPASRPLKSSLKTPQTPINLSTPLHKPLFTANSSKKKKKGKKKKF